MKAFACTIAVLTLLAAAQVGHAQGTTRVLNANDLKSLQVYFEGYFAENGKMPDKAEIIATLKADKNAGNLVKVIDDGFLVLTGATQREAVWAYEAAALTKGGFVLSNQGLEKLSAVDAKKRVGK